MSPADLPWWGWILLSVALWVVQLIVSASSDTTIRTNKHTTFFWVVRALLVIGMFASALIGIVRFVKWVWNA